MRKRIKAKLAELARVGEVVAGLEAELARVAAEARHTRALHDEFRTAAFAAWSAEVERLTTEFGERFSSAFGGIEELQLLSSTQQEMTEAVLADLKRTSSDVSALAKDMEAVGGLTKDVSALAKQFEKEQGRLSETSSTVAEQATRADALAAGLAAIQRSLAAAATSMTSTTPATAGTSAAPDSEQVDEVPLDRLAAETVYAAIEDRLRGSPEAIRQQQSGYLDLIRKLPGSKPVADLGCGRGEFLSLLAESDIAGVGVDLSSAFVAECREQGLDVKEQDLLAFLGSQKDKSLRAVVSFQVLEHLPFPVLLRTYAEAFRVLVPGGLFLNETPNGANLAVGGSTFWLDHTHVRPLHPELLRHFAEFYGYSGVRVDLVSKPEVPWRLGPEAGGEAVGDAVLGLQEYVLSGQDALLVAYRPKEPRKPRASKASTTRAKRSS